MPLPNFILFGAPKAGTTSLHEALDQHPEVWMSQNKEPVFFSNAPAADQNEKFQLSATDPTGGKFYRSVVDDAARYLALFDGVTDEKAIGEASVTYLRSFVACRRLSRLIPDIKLVAVLRQPADRAWSNYWYLVQNGVEPAPTFEQALADEPHRIAAGWTSMTHHKEWGYYGRQLALYYEHFPRENFKIFLYDDWRADPQRVLRELFDFVGVSADFEPQIPRANRTLVPRNRALAAWVRALHPIHGNSRIRPALLRRAFFGTMRRINARANMEAAPKISPEVRARLTEEYRPDILQLQELLGRDLSAWLK